MCFVEQDFGKSEAMVLHIVVRRLAQEIGKTVMQGMAMVAAGTKALVNNKRFIEKVRM
jgi:hypothetical protein